MVLSAGTLTTGSVILPAAAPTPTVANATPTASTASTSIPTAVDVSSPFATPYSPANMTPALTSVGSSSAPGGVLGVSTATTTTAPANTFAPASADAYSTLNSSTPSVTTLPTSLADFLTNPLYMSVAGLLLILYVRSK